MTSAGSVPGREGGTARATIDEDARVNQLEVDHATNLAEQVVFMVKGKDVRHLGKLPTTT